MSFFDLESEKEYQTWPIGLLSSVPGYRLASNREAGEGRFNICLTPRVPRRSGVLVEVKVGSDKDASEEEMRRLATSGASQMRNKRYAAELRAENVRSILEFGIAFSGKKAYVVTGNQYDLESAHKKE